MPRAGTYKPRPPVAGVCAHCGAGYEATPRRRYCSDRCRRDALTARRRKGTPVGRPKTRSPAASPG
jgi:hypothetical protein